MNPDYKTPAELLALDKAERAAEADAQKRLNEGYRRWQRRQTFIWLGIGLAFLLAAILYNLP